MNELRERVAKAIRAAYWQDVTHGDIDHDDDGSEVTDWTSEADATLTVFREWLGEHTWTRTDALGRTSYALATEVRPGVIEVSTDLMRDLMRDAGWTEVGASGTETGQGEPRGGDVDSGATDVLLGRIGTIQEENRT